MPDNYRYPWPASAISEKDMNLLFLARESSSNKTPITQTLVYAIRAQYGHLAHPLETSTQHGTESTLRPAA